MTAPLTVAEALLQNALGPASVTIDGRGSATAKTADDLIKIDQYLAARQAAQNCKGTFGLRFSQIKTPAAG